MRNARMVAFVLLLGITACGDSPSNASGELDTDVDASVDVAQSDSASPDAAVVDTSDVAADPDGSDAADVGGDVADGEGSAFECPFETCPPPPVACEGADCPALIETRAVVPGTGLPEQAVLQPANNNLDVIAFDGRVFFAFRTAPSHFASGETQLHIVSSTDELTWTHEATLDEDTDLREPRFAIVGESLFMYYAVLGDSPTDFEPQGMRVIERTADGWSAPEWAWVEAFIPWRTGIDESGTSWLIGYDGGANIYDFNGEPLRVQWLQTSDGRNFEPYVGDDPVVLTGGGSETAAILRDDGSMVAVVRNEAGTDRGFGSQVCRAAAESLNDWECRFDPRKFDSPLVFEAAGVIWLVARRHLTDTGYYDLGFDDLDLATQEIRYQWEYWNTPKRCSLWRVDPDSFDVTFVLDLPSRGDTCFASVLDGGDDVRVIYNYSSPIDGTDHAWNRGQARPTNIYRHVIDFAPVRGVSGTR